MLDFAKSIMVGNARTIVGQVGSAKIYYDTEEDEYYTDCGGSIYDNPGFKTKNDAVNYIVKKIKAGNSKVGNATDRNGKELKVGDMVAVKTSDPTLNHGRIVRISGDQISVDVTGEDDIWTTPARKAVKMG